MLQYKIRSKLINVYELDHSSGHTKVKVDGLGVNLLNESWGGKQSKMQYSKMVAGYLGDENPF